MPKPRTGVRYTVPTGAQGEFQPDSRGRVLKNLLSITQKTVMDRIEVEALIAAQTDYLKSIGPNTRFTSTLLRAMHRLWLGRIYAWAGEFRSVELQKGGFRWPPAYLVERNMAALETGLLQRHTPCPPGPLAEVARRIAEVHAELLLIHPYRDGNGRLARWLAEEGIVPGADPAQVCRHRNIALRGAISKSCEPAIWPP